MSTTIILPPAAALESAAAELRESVDAKAQRAIDKALYDLLTATAQIVRISGAYLVPSTSRGGLIHRVDDVQGCSCEAGAHGGSCRHTAALAIIEAAQQHTMPSLIDTQRADRAARARAAAESFNAEIFG